VSVLVASLLKVLNAFSPYIRPHSYIQVFILHSGLSCEIKVSNLLPFRGPFLVLHFFESFFACFVLSDSSDSIYLTLRQLCDL